jgi:pimeloyl-ACP methyl ester carboxylesterase
MRRAALLIASLVTVGPLVALSSAGEASPADFTPEFHLADCPADVFPEDRDVDCGFVEVPERWGRPEGPTIRVAAAYVHATSPDPHEDPVVFLDGGPSVGAIAPFPLGTYFADWEYLDDRDLVLVDTRGTGISEPRLSCPELDRAQVRAFYAPPFINSQAPSIMPAALTRCWNRLVESGVDPAAYTTAQSAADLEALREALGVAQWNLLAISADGPLGLTYMRRHPEGIRSAIIDSGFSTQMLWGLDYDRGLVRMLNRVFAGCAADADCAARYPGIRQRFYSLVRELQRAPVRVTLPDFEPEPVTLEISGAGLLSDTAGGIWPGNADFPQGIGFLLDTVWRRTHGELRRTYREFFGTGPEENWHGEDFVATGKSMSYLCHDNVAFLTRADLRRAAQELPWFADRYLSPDYDYSDGYLGNISPAGCRSWPVGSAPSIQHEPVHSDIPTLAFGGEFDLGVPPYTARQVVAGLSSSTYVRIPAASHLQLMAPTHGSDCARSIAEAFLDDPALTPDTTCVAEVPAFDFGAAVAPGPGARCREWLLPDFSRAAADASSSGRSGTCPP